MTSKTNKKPRVDILLPYWGEFNLLKKAVDSVLEQTESNWRLLIVDDCYPSKEASDYYANFTDKRVTYYRHAKNLGLVDNYNYIVSRSTAEFCVVMGCDDIMLPTYLENSLKRIGMADYYQPRVSVINDKDEEYLPGADRVKRLLRPKRQGIHSGESVAVSLCHGNWTYFPSIMWKTNTLKRYMFDRDKPNTQDLVIQLNILRDGGSVFIDNTTTFLYRRSATSFSSKAKSGTRFNEEKKVYSDLAEHFYQTGWKKAARAARTRITVRIHKALS